jgi:hypothetical protein
MRSKKRMRGLTIGFLSKIQVRDANYDSWMQTEIQLDSTH